MKHHRGFIALVLVLAPAIMAVAAQSPRLTVEPRGNVLRLSAPQLHFVEGKPLEQLHNGSPVTYVFQVSVTDESGAARWQHLEARFVVSYDLWEEKFAVVAAGEPRRSASHLTSSMLEAWCLENVPLRVAAVPADKTFVVKLRCLVAHDEPPPAERFTLSALIDALSRKRDAAPPEWEAVSAPMRLAGGKDRARQ